MAINQQSGQVTGHGSENATGEKAPDYVFDGTSAAIVVPVGDALLNAEYSRSGPDLYLETPDGQVILVTDYFSQQVPPDLFTLAGSRITSDVAAKLAGPLAPGQVAQSGDLTTLEEPIGTVDTIKGTITVIRADGSQATLVEGDQLYQGDTLASGPDSALGIIFADKSTMSMAANARIILDELIYDPENMAGNSQVFNVIQGAFMFTSGAIGKSDPEDVSVKTPVATIGIRGTKFGISVDALDGSSNVTVFEGAVFIQNAAGNVLLTGIGETTLIPSYSIAPSDPKVLDLEEIQRIYGDAIGFHPVRQEIPDDHAAADDDDLQDIADELDDIETAAGGDEQGGEGASTEFGAIGDQGFGENGLGGTPLGEGGGEEEGGPVFGGGTGGGDDDDDDIIGPGPVTGEEPEVVEVIDPGLGDFDEETGITHFTPSTPLTSGTNFTVSAPSGPGVQQLHLNAEAVGSAASGDSNLTLQSGGTPDNVQSGNNSVSLSSTDGMNLSIHGFEELALTLGGGNDAIDIQDLGGTSIIADTVTIDAGDGDDIITTSDGVTSTSLVVNAGEGNDIVSGSELNDEIFGEAGNDIIQAGAGDDFVSGGTGDDVLVGAAGDDVLEGNEDNDLLTGDAGNDTLLGGSGDDFLEGGSGSDVVDGGEGNDRAVFIVGQEQTDDINDTYIGGADTDTLVINFDADVLANATFRGAILDIYGMLGGAASGAIAEVDTTPFAALGVDIQGFELFELDGPSVLLPADAAPTGDEDASIQLNIAVTAVLPGNTVTVTIGNLNGATLVNDEGSPVGTDNGDGTFTLTAAQLEGLSLIPAANSSDDLNLSITVSTESESGFISSVDETLDVVVNGVADAPELEVQNVGGLVNSAIALDIQSSLLDTDGSEELVIRISNVPVTGSFVDGDGNPVGTDAGDGVFAFSPDELSDIFFIPPAGNIGVTQLTVTATATEENGDSESVAETLTVTVSDGSAIVLQPGQDLDLVAPAGDAQKLVLDASFGDATSGDDWVIAQDELGRVTLTNTATGQLVTADGYEEIDIDFGPGEDTIELRDLSNTDLSNDTLTLNTGDGDDTVVASEDVNRDLEIYGGAGNDDLQGSNGDDLIDGGADDDILSGGGGVDALNGGEGSDTYVWAAGDGVDAYNDTGTEGTDTIVAQAETFDGIGDGFSAATTGIEAIGRDSDGDGTIDTGSPLLIALSDSSETVDFSGLDFMNSQTTINLGGGDDTVTASAGAGEAVTYIGGEGQDTLNLLITADTMSQIIAAGQLAALQSYIASPQDAELSLASPAIHAQGFENVLIGVLGSDGTVTDVTDALANAISDDQGIGETIFGTDAAELIFAGGGNDVVRSFGGNDALFGGDGEDYLNAGDGDDFIDGGDGNDILDGGTGDDVLIGGEGADLVSGGTGDDQISGGAGNDFLAGFSGDDVIDGGSGDDFLSGSNGEDSLFGGEGNDRLFGGNGDDFLIGGEGIDVLHGERGDDVLISSGYDDQLFGGQGNDLLISSMDDLPASRVSSGAQGSFNGIRDGGEGEDTFRLTSDEAGAHALSGDEFSNLRNIETLDLSGVDELHLSLRVEDVVTMTDEDNDLTILLGENVTSIQIEDETIQLEDGQAIFQQDGVQVILQQQQPAPEAS